MNLFKLVKKELYHACAFTSFRIPSHVRSHVLL